MPGIGQFFNWVGETVGGNGQSDAGLLGGGAFKLKPYEFDPASQENLNALSEGAQGRLDTAQSNQLGARDAQMGLLAQLQAQAAGGGPSLAQNQLTQATDANLRQAMALGQAQQGQGVGAAGALRSIADNQAAIGQNSANQSAQLRAQEQLNAQAGIANVAGGMRQQDQSGVNNETGLLGQLSGQNVQYQGMQAQNQIAGQDIQQRGFSDQARGRRDTIGGIAQAGQNIAGVGKTPVTTMALGGMVPGYAFGGATDSESNDTVPAMLSPGEVVLPRSVALAEDAPRKAADFIRAVKMAKRFRKKAA